MKLFPAKECSGITRSLAMSKKKTSTFFRAIQLHYSKHFAGTIKTVLTVHDLVAFIYPNTHNKKATLLKTSSPSRLRRAAHVCAVSENTCTDILQRFHYEPNKIDVVYCKRAMNLSQ
jgi:hypothetical protein